MTLSVAISSNLARIALEVNFAAQNGVTAIFGASGAGKTTVINAIAGLFAPDRGAIRFDETVFFDSSQKINVAPKDRQVGYVFQDHRLFPHLTAGANLTYGQRARGLARNPDLEQRITSMLGLSPLLDRYPARLSGGEKQRVAIGRALLSEPRVLLLDEPLASLDQARRQEILPYLERLRDQANLPILYVSHSVSEVARLANQVVLLDKGQQHQVGTVSDVFSDPLAASAIGPQDLGAIIVAQIAAQHEDGVTELASSAGPLFLSQSEGALGTLLRVRIRAQDVMLSRHKPQDISALNILRGEIAEIQDAPSLGVLVQLKCGEDRVLARITQRSRQAMDLQIGQALYAVLKTVSVATNDIGREAH